ncbi:hypothetical protein [Acidovorax sp. Root219]|uniref:hypothetical protein n=1 Tax=Acidovorax sp. Root219 TaxID=1736493 RepID=UPI00070AA447|nr:hypothetical protein [Acidovorax sp. Root219]KRC26606.1 hypothetical protein ASE28_23400 [Acidovorax sp. Root219]
MNKGTSATTIAALAAGLALSAALAGCDPKQPQAAQTAPLPVADVSTPDRALKSYWAQIDWLTASDHALKRHNRAGDSFQQGTAGLSKVATAQLVSDVKFEQPLYTYSREISEAKVETDSRAIVVTKIRNSTPLPPGTTLTAADTKRREEGDQYKYVMEKQQEAWKVAEIWRWSSYGSTYEKVQPIEGSVPPIYVTFGGY